jgi:cell division protein FtsI/penicillin-binding protein 2
MSFTILTNNQILYKKFSRRNFLFLLATLPLLNSFKSKEHSLSKDLKTILYNHGTALVADIKTGKLIGCSNIYKASRAYTIGSLAKLITTTALLEENIITPDHSYYCKGYEIVRGKKVFCWNPNGHGMLNLESAIAQSCNLYFLTAAEKIAPPDILKYYYIYHFDNAVMTSNVEIETRFNLPTSGKIEEITLGTNKNMLITPLQMLNFATTLARQGNYIPLWEGEIQPGSKQLPLKNSTFASLHGGMLGAATSGTTKLLSSKGVSVAAKTGTAPASKNFTHGWCIGYTPADNPALAFCIFIDRGTGFSDAVPLTEKVLEVCKNHYLI